MGVAVPVPSWVVILEAAAGDPLRAQEIENGVNKFWYERWSLWNKLKSQAVKARSNQSKPAGRKHGN